MTKGLRNGMRGITLLAILTISAASAAQEAPAPQDPATQTKTERSDWSEFLDPRYFGAMGIYTETHEDRQFVDYGGGLRVYLGSEFNESLNTELVFSGTVMETESEDTDFYQYMLGVDAVYLFDREGFQPYLVAGGGVVHDDVFETGEDDETGGYLNAGLGFIGGQLNRRGISLRADIRYVYDFNLDGIGEVRAGIGFHVPVGSSIHIGDKDSDGDGVVDSADNCPDTMRGLVVDGHGCAIAQTLVLEGVSFDFNSTRLGVNAQTILKAVVATMLGQPSMQVEIAGHTDNVGSDTYNQSLSQSRAEAVRNHLISKGVNEASLRARGYGEAQPVASNDDDFGREQNRRVEFRIESK